MNVLPKQRVSVAQWAHNAWDEARGVGVTVPADALQVLLDAYVERGAMDAAARARLRVIVEPIQEFEPPLEVEESTG